MRRLFSHVLIGILTFALGTIASSIVNFSGDSLVEYAEDGMNFGHATLMWQEPQLIPPYVNSCGHLIVTIASDRKLNLNSKEKGTLDDPGDLLWTLRQAFRVRTEMHVYRHETEATSDLPEDQRIDKTVYVKASRSLSYGEVADLIQKLKDIGANPIGLVTEMNCDPH
jgi:biopolymer transport protein ExbD